MKKLSTLICLLFFIAACRPDPLERAREQVSIDMSREEAIRILSEQTWYHQPCENQISIDDLFFYGDHRYDKADVVIVTSALKDGIYRVTHIGSFDTYAWHSVYKDCIQRDKFED